MIIPAKHPNREGLRFNGEHAWFSQESTGSPRSLDAPGRLMNHKMLCFPRNPSGSVDKPCSVSSVQLFEASLGLEWEQYYKQPVLNHDLPGRIPGRSLKAPWRSLRGSKGVPGRSPDHQILYFPNFRGVPGGPLYKPCSIQFTSVVQNIAGARAGGILQATSPKPGWPWGAPGDPQRSHGGSLLLGILEGPGGIPGTSLGGPCRSPGASLGGPWRSLEAPWGILEGPGGSLERPLAVPGGPLEVPGDP